MPVPRRHEFGPRGQQHISNEERRAEGNRRRISPRGAFRQDAQQKRRRRKRDDCWDDAPVDDDLDHQTHLRPPTSATALPPTTATKSLTSRRRFQWLGSLADEDRHRHIRLDLVRPPVHAELHSIDDKLARQRETGGGEAGDGRETNFPRHTVKSQLTADAVPAARVGRLDAGGVERRGGELAELKEVRALEVRGQPVELRPEGIGLNLYANRC